MLKKIFFKFVYFLSLEHDRIVGRELRKNYQNKRENLTENNILLREDKIRILHKHFKNLKKQVLINHDRKFTHEQLYELCLFKKEYNQLKK